MELHLSLTTPFIRKWRLRHKAVADSLEDGDACRLQRRASCAVGRAGSCITGPHVLRARTGRQHQDRIRSGWTRQESREGRAERERCQEFAANLPAKRVHKKRRKKKTRR